MGWEGTQLSVSMYVYVCVVMKQRRDYDTLRDEEPSERRKEECKAERMTEWERKKELYEDVRLKEGEGEREIPPSSHAVFRSAISPALKWKLFLIRLC